MSLYAVEASSCRSLADGLIPILRPKATGALVEVQVGCRKTAHGTNVIDPGAGTFQLGQILKGVLKQLGVFGFRSLRSLKRQNG
jgi:hypothetical protein